MGFRFRRSINLGAGFRINLSGSGVGYSWGVKGFRLTKTSKGTTRMTASIPGTGISYVEEKGAKKLSNAIVSDQNTDTEVRSDDEKLMAAIVCVLKEGSASTSLLQRRLKVGYRVASDLIDKMEHKGIVGPFNGLHARQVLIRQDQFEEYTKDINPSKRLQGMERLKLIGKMNRVLLVKDDIIKIVDLGGLFSSIKKEKFLVVTDVINVEVKKPNIYPGYIQFQMAGQVPPNVAGRGVGFLSVLIAATDENSLTFVGEDNYQTALAIQRHVQSFNAQQKTTAVVASLSSADEI